MFCFDYISNLGYLIPKGTFWRSLKKCKKNQFFWHIFSSNCCQYWKIEFRCLVYPKTFIFYPKKMKTSERKQFWKIRNCAPLEALWGVPPLCPLDIFLKYFFETFHMPIAFNKQFRHFNAGTNSAHFGTKFLQPLHWTDGNKSLFRVHSSHPIYSRFHVNQNKNQPLTLILKILQGFHLFHFLPSKWRC